MASKIEHLTFTSELKTTLLQSLAEKKQIQPSVSYDDDFDALVILFVPTNDVIVHYINDDHVALLYEGESKEIVGMQIEDFEHSFLPRHDNVNRIWRLSQSDARIENVGDLILAVELKKPQVAREVFKSTEELLRKRGFKFGSVFA